MGLLRGQTGPFKSGFRQDKARTMLLESSLPGTLWGEIILTSCVLRNLSPTSSLSITPLEAWTGRRPSVQHLRVMGCKAYCQLDKVERNGKFSAKAWIGVLVGYSIDTPGNSKLQPSQQWDCGEGEPDPSGQGSNDAARIQSAGFLMG